MDCVSTQGSVACSHIYPHEPLGGLSSTSPLSSPPITCSSIEKLPPISHLSPSITSPSYQQPSYTPNHEILTSKHGQTILSMDSHITQSHVFDLNGNIQDSQHFSDYHDQDYEEQCYQTALAQSEHCNYSNSYYAGENFIYAMHNSNHEGMHDSQTYHWYGPQASYDSEDSFEVETTDHVVFPDNTIPRTPQFGPIIRNTPQSDGGSPLPNFSVFTAELKKVPNRRGRPVTYNKPGYNYSDSDSLHSDEDERTAQSKGCRRGAKNILLWKFLLGELRKPNSNHIKWENEREGIFKFVDTAECSRLWGQMKKKEDMNFEKLSRGIRHYYKDGLMSRRDGIRLVYKFNWDRVPRAFWPRRH
ncbi:protein C-ets-1-like isoform X2 [Mercenaria mercenaria]|nr:protein C-ets-1-like isoform X2 [Mercenaria mercenaria]